MERPDDPLLSPVLNEAVLWFLTRWAKTYLLPDLNLYKNHVRPQTPLTLARLLCFLDSNW